MFSLLLPIRAKIKFQKGAASTKFSAAAMTHSYGEECILNTDIYLVKVSKPYISNSGYQRYFSVSGDSFTCWKTQ